MVEKLLEVIQEVLGKLMGTIVNPFRKLAMTMFDFCFSGLTEGLADAFTNPILAAFLYIVNIFSWAVFAFALLFYFLKIAQEERRNWGVIMRCPVNTIIFILFNQIIAQLCFLLPCYAIRAFQVSSSLSMIGSSDFLDAKFGGIAKNLTFFVCAIAVIGFFIVTVMRIGAMMIQIMSAPFYVPYALMGESQKVMEWMLGTISVGFTYVIQFAMFYGGVLIWTYAGKDIVSAVIGISLLFGTFAVPKGMQKFGWSSGAGHGFQSATMSGNMLISGVKSFAPKG